MKDQEIIEDLHARLYVALRMCESASRFLLAWGPLVEQYHKGAGKEFECQALALDDMIKDFGSSPAGKVYIPDLNGCFKVEMIKNGNVFEGYIPE